MNKILFETPWLVQRLEKPICKTNLPFDKGYIKEGLSRGVGVVIANIMQFDYMGSAEFEWGALPKSLEYCIKYAIDNNLIACEIDIIGRKGISKSVYYICHKDIEEDIVNWLKKAGKNEHSHTKEGVRLQDIIDNLNSFRYCGWYDLGNKFWFFTDKEMFLNVKRLFGV